MPYKDLDKRRAAAKKGGEKWRKAHPGRAAEVRRKCYYRDIEHSRKRAREWYHANREKCLARLRVGQLKRYYGLSPDEYAALGDCCAICGATEDGRVKAKTNKKFRLAVDHCHDTHKVRGLLCGNCNAGIGLFQHDVERLERAIAYLKGSMTCQQL